MRSNLFKAKKGALSLSINAIVVVVLAFVMLGLGLTLTRNIFGNIGDTQAQISEQVRQQILDDLRTGNKKLSFPSTDIRIEFGDQRIIAFGIKNTGSAADNYCAHLTAKDAAGTAVTTIQYVFDRDIQSLGATESRVIPVTIRGEATQGLYQGKISVYRDVTDGQTSCPTDGNFPIETWAVYDTKSFFINIV